MQAEVCGRSELQDPQAYILCQILYISCYGMIVGAYASLLLCSCYSCFADSKVTKACHEHSQTYGFTF